MHNLIPATDYAKWRELLKPFGALDASFQPEYHAAYSLRVKNSTPLLWYFEMNGAHFIYPFLLTPISFDDEETEYYDISSIYGYTGPIATSTDSEFINSAWSEFDNYASKHNIIAEFIRFSPLNSNQNFAHKNTKVKANRNLAVSHLPDSEDALLEKLGSKTRNMLRKAERAGLTCREMELPGELKNFRELYESTMTRNQAPDFFWYDDAYYENLLMLGKSGLRLFGVFFQNQLVAAAMAVIYNKSALYHLGASLVDYAKQGAGNLSIFYMSRELMKSGVTFINMTGGRTTNDSDPLLLFKKSNATGLATFYIGKRIINKKAYMKVSDAWQNKNKVIPDAQKIIFWRH